MSKCSLCDHHDTDPCIPDDERAADRLYRYSDIVNKLDELEAEINAVESIPMDDAIDLHHVQDLLDEIDQLQEELDALMEEEADENERADNEEFLKELAAVDDEIKSGAEAYAAYEASAADDAEIPYGDSKNYREIDVDHIESLVYSFYEDNGDVNEVVIDLPAELRVSLDSGAHYIVDVANVGSVIPTGWRELTVYPKAGEKPFKFVD